ncbi:hypothetical protein VP01_1460g1 [Puccinia sorghi]|uniref:Uncharacterized protein n=1 Tax=Puccinia sorghi TaxID=27349 RepID=A0A0L6VJU3_9BASI|nr:hypothetical protein VP01_1460g1 [Puccinia sorghi]
MYRRSASLQVLLNLTIRKTRKRPARPRDDQTDEYTIAQHKLGLQWCYLVTLTVYFVFEASIFYKHLQHNLIRPLWWPDLNLNYSAEDEAQEIKTSLEKMNQSEQELTSNYPKKLQPLLFEYTQPKHVALEMKNKDSKKMKVQPTQKLQINLPSSLQPLSLPPGPLYSLQKQIKELKSKNPFFRLTFSLGVLGYINHGGCWSPSSSRFSTLQFCSGTLLLCCLSSYFCLPSGQCSVTLLGFASSNSATSSPPTSEYMTSKMISYTNSSLETLPPYSPPFKNLTGSTNPATPPKIPATNSSKNFMVQLCKIFNNYYTINHQLWITYKECGTT